jgi:hypothetical protein
VQLPIWNAPLAAGTECRFTLEQGLVMAETRTFVFKQLPIMQIRQTRCKTNGMNICLAILGFQLVAFLISLLRESGEDARFAEEKVIYRS